MLSDREEFPWPEGPEFAEVLQQTNKIVASNLPDEANSLRQSLIHFLPRRTLLHRRSVSDMTQQHQQVQPTVEPVCGNVHLEIHPGTWRHAWCQYMDGYISFRNAEMSSTNVGGRIQIVFCHVMEEASPEALSTALESKEGNDIHSRFVAVMSSAPGGATFCLWSGNARIVCRTESKHTCDKFVETITRDLQTRMSRELWNEKVAAVHAMTPYTKFQYVLQCERNASLLMTLSRTRMGTTGSIEDELPITSLRKEKSGVLCMLAFVLTDEDTEDVARKWKDFYFVLFEGALYYYTDSKCTTPAGFIVLDYASVLLEPKRLSKGDCVFRVQTSLETVVCKTRHTVALSEWVTALEHAVMELKTNEFHIPDDKDRKNNSRFSGMSMFRTMSQTKNKPTRTYNSHRMLQDIKDMMTNISTLDRLVMHKDALETFCDYLMTLDKTKQQRVSYVRFFADIEHFRISESEGKLGESADALFDKFLIDSSPSYLASIPVDVRQRVEEQLKHPVPEMFDQAQAFVASIINDLFTAFKKSEEYTELNDRLSSPVETERKVEDFAGKVIMGFTLKVKGKPKSQEIKFDLNSNVLTIGRDKSNDIVMEDSRVSRSHARIMYDNKQCVFIDLGSSCGSKLNGRPVLRSRLIQGDAIELGQSTLIFCIKKKSRFSLW